jgi:hypothetical protein
MRFRISLLVPNPEHGTNRHVNAYTDDYVNACEIARAASVSAQVLMVSVYDDELNIHKADYFYGALDK